MTEIVKQLERAESLPLLSPAHVVAAAALLLLAEHGEYTVTQMDDVRYKFPVTRPVQLNLPTELGSFQSNLRLSGMPALYQEDSSPARPSSDYLILELEHSKQPVRSGRQLAARRQRWESLMWFIADCRPDGEVMVVDAASRRGLENEDLMKLNFMLTAMGQELRRTQRSAEFATAAADASYQTDQTSEAKTIPAGVPSVIPFKKRQP